MPFIPKPPFPNVPKLPGVPQVARSNLFPAGPPPILTGVIALGRLALAIITKPTWGIEEIPQVDTTAVSQDEADARDAEAPLDEVVDVKPPRLVPDSFSKFQYKQEWQVSTVPIQEGAFASYDKVNTPFEITVRMTKGGTLASRQKFLNTLEGMAQSLAFYKIITPERSYLKCNITGYRIVRDGARDAYFLTEVELSFVEIREVAAQYTNTAANTQNAKNSSARPVVNKGTLNAITPVSRVAAAVDAALAPLRRLSSLIGN